MKRILFILLVFLTTSILVHAQHGKSYNRDSVSKGKTTIVAKTGDKSSRNSTSVTVESEDVAATDSTQTDTVITYHNQGSNQYLGIDVDDFPFNINRTIGGGILVAIIFIIAAFGLPIFILFFVFFFRYKNRKARYHLAEQALAAGQPLPDNFIKESRPTNPQSQGIRNTFTGIGLFVFLWAITDEFGIGAIGLLVMFMGIGQWITGIRQEKKQHPDESNQ